MFDNNHPCPSPVVISLVDKVNIIITSSSENCEISNDSFPERISLSKKYSLRITQLSPKFFDIETVHLSSSSSSKKNSFCKEISK